MAPGGAIFVRYAVLQAGFRKARTYENRRAATQGDELGRGIGPASPAGPYIISSSVKRERPLPRAMGS